IYWIATENDDALATLAAVEQALTSGTTGTPPPALPITQPAPADDGYLAQNLALAEATWAVDPQRIVVSSRPQFGMLINLFQRLVRRLTWWYALPQWLQISEHHGAQVRSLNALANHERQSRARIAALEAELARLHAIERQVQVLRFEQTELRRRIGLLEEALLRRAEADHAE
ncbi:MAG TPA: hypothetical protein PKC19_22865, partial [Roseiflexaceae bacterium]|nr:hypothetical protein [Roseiflexaceae bacterium]